MSNHDSFEREFRRRAGGMRRTPAARNWNRLEHRLDRRGGRTIGMRPWMIAAVLFVFAGVAGLMTLPDRTPNPLAQRAQEVVELSTPHYGEAPARYRDYEPVPEETREGFLVVKDQPRLAVSPKYRM